VTVLVEETEAAPVVEKPAPNTLAGWHIRAAALLVDVLPGLAVSATAALVGLAVPLRSTWWWICAVALAAAALLTMVNRVVLPAIFGWSLGRALMGITVVGPDGATVGVGRLLLRELAHLLDTVSVFVGWLWPLWDARRRTFADLLLHTEVHVVEPDRRSTGVSSLTARIVLGAALLCVGAGGIGVLGSLLPDRESDKTAAAVLAEGPKIVVEMLTYDPKTLRENFDRARSLTTDKYRPQLIQQQEAVQKGHPAVNEYWVTDATVLSAKPNGATMLLFMQGHRGGDNEQRFITATVRVTFVKATGARWLVDDLNVITKPKPAKGQK
jgi:Mce-associated membrane protein